MALSLLGADNVYHPGSNGGNGTEESRVDQSGGEDETEVQDPVQRFLAVVKFYLSGWHIKPPGVKKPMNPILGETFTGYWDYSDGTRGYYISEQTCHHPPKSSYFFMAPEHGIRIDGALKPRSRFLGNSAASMMEGVAVLRFMNIGKSRGGEK
ncbi:MAG: hypothetical protein Q9183_002766 [Haloplaca sp. 2 TL-2023]